MTRKNRKEKAAGAKASAKQAKGSAKPKPEHVELKATKVSAEKSGMNTGIDAGTYQCC